MLNGEKNGESGEQNLPLFREPKIDSYRVTISNSLHCIRVVVKRIM